MIGWLARFTLADEQLDVEDVVHVTTFAVVLFKTTVVVPLNTLP